MQMTVMSIPAGGDIGLEMHPDIDQFLRVEAGTGIMMMGDTEDNLDFEARVEHDFAIFIPAGKWHNLMNDSDEPLKVYSIYAPGCLLYTSRLKIYLQESSIAHSFAARIYAVFQNTGGNK